MLKNLITAYQGCSFSPALSDQQAIERVFVVLRQVVQFQDVEQINREQDNSIFSLLLGNNFSEGRA